MKQQTYISIKQILKIDVEQFEIQVVCRGSVVKAGSRFQVCLKPGLLIQMYCLEYAGFFFRKPIEFIQAAKCIVFFKN